MARTQITGDQVKDATIQRKDLDVTTSSQAVTTKIVAGAGISLNSTGADEGTGDVTVAVTGLADVATSGDYTDLTNTPTIPLAINDLSDVVITTPANDQVLKYDGTSWINAAAPATGASSLDELSDVVITSAAKGQFIVNNGTNFINSNTIEASGAAVKPLIIKGAASQTANLFEAQNSSGTAVVQFTNAGAATFASNINFGAGPCALAAFGANGVALGRNSSTGESGLVLGSFLSSGQNEMRIGWGGGGTGRIMYGLSTGEVGIGVASPGAQLHLSPKTTAMKGLIVQSIASQTANLLEVQNSAGTVLTQIRADGTVALSTNTTTNGSAGFSASAFAANGSSSELSFYKSRNATLGSNTIVNAGDYLGAVQFWGANGSSYNRAATIACAVDGTPGASNDMPGRIEFYTTADGNGDFVAERMRLNNAGNLGIGTTGNPGARLHVSLAGNGNPAVPGTKGLIIQGAASQTANLLEVQNSSGTSVLQVDSSGAFALPGASSPVIVKGHADSAFNTSIFRVGNSNLSSIFMNVRGDGRIAFGLGTHLQGNNTYYGGNIGAEVSITAGSTMPLIIRQGSGGEAPLYPIFAVESNNIIPIIIARREGTVLRHNGEFNSSVPLTIIGNHASQTGDLLKLKNNSNTDVFAISASGSITVGTVPVARVTGLATVATSGNYADLSNTPTIPSALDNLSDVVITTPSNDQVLKFDGTNWINAAAPASGASSLDELSDVVITSASQGEFLVHNGTNFINSNTIEVSSASVKPLIIKGAASQTANLLEVQNSVGTALVAIGSAGFIQAPPIANTYVTISSDSSASETMLRLYSPNNGSGNWALFFQRVVARKCFDINPFSFAGGPSVSVNVPTTLGVGLSADIESKFQVNTGSAATKGIIVRGAASQTANLLEVQNSSGTALFSINSAGNASINGIAAGTNGVSTSTVFAADTATDLTGADNTFIGYQAGKGTTSGYANVVVGSQAYNNGSSATGYQNICIGTYAGGAANAKLQMIIIGTAANARGGRTLGIAIGHVAEAGTRAVALGQGAIANDNTLEIKWGGSSGPTFAGKITGDTAGAVTVTGDFNAKRFVETSTNAFNTSLAPSSGTLTVDSSVGNVVFGALNASVTTWAFTNVPTDNSRVTTVTVVLEGNASYTYGDACSVNGDAVTNGVRWSGGSAPTATANTDIITFVIARDSAGTVRVFGSATTNFS